MTDLGEASKILGMTIERDKNLGTISIYQKNYTLEILKRFSMDKIHPVHTPGVGKELSRIEPGAVKFSETDKKTYQAIVGSLIYLTQCTRLFFTRTHGWFACFPRLKGNFVFFETT